MTKANWKTRLLALLFGISILAGCGGGGGDGGGVAPTPTPTTSPTPTPTAPPGCGTSGTISVCITASATTLTANGTSNATLTANVTDNGAAIADGTVVNFTLNNALATLSTASATTTGGNASVTVTAGNTVGSTLASATYSGATSSVTLTLSAPVSAPSAGGIQFLSATPNVIGIKGGAQVTSSAIKFKVTDPTGAAIPSTAVAFTMDSSLHGGEYIGLPDGTPTTASGTTDSNGEVSVVLNSGSVAGPVTVRASVTTSSGTFSAASSTVSIGGGIPVSTHISISASPLNTAGLLWDGLETDISVRVSDLFTNYDVLAGTTVSFYTEAGAIKDTGILDASGLTTVKLRSQDPRPAGTDGRVRVLAVVAGQECFTDTNGNGLYDAGEPLVNMAGTSCDIGEPYIDANNTGSYDPGEFYLDTNANGVYDGVNGIWDGPGCTGIGCNQSPLVWASMDVMYTGNVTTCSIAPPIINVPPNGGSQSFLITVGDSNGNLPVAGTTFSITLDGDGKLVGQTSYTIPDGLGAAYTAPITIYSTDVGNVNPPVFTILTLKVTGGPKTLACPDVFVVGFVD